MNLATHYHDDPSWTIKDCFDTAAGEMDGDLCGLWAIVARGRYGFRLKDNDLREFVFSYILTLLTHDGVPIVGTKEVRARGNRVWKKTDRYGIEPVAIAEAITEEWIRQGEIDPPAYNGVVAFTLPDYLESEDNIWDDTYSAVTQDP